MIKPHAVRSACRLGRLLVLPVTGGLALAGTLAAALTRAITTPAAPY
jgi:hypothetical protein